MTRDEAIAGLTEFGKNALDMAINALEQEPCKDGWIPVSERLPKAGEYIGDGDVAKYYLVQNEYGDMMVARYTHSEYWEQIYKLKPIGDEIVAWRELPEPYVPDINVGNRKWGKDMVAIKDMKMPKNCAECKLFHFYFDANGAIHYVCKCKSIEIFSDLDKRNDSCPLIEIESEG